MYSMVMMMAVAGSGDVASFGGRNKGCDGGCSGYAVASSSSCGGKHGGFLGGRRDRGGSCCGVTAAPACCAAPAPVCAPVCAPAPVCCPAPVATCGCDGGGHKLFGRRKGNGCYSAPTNCCSAPVASCCGGASAYAAAPCSTGTAVMPAVPATPAKEMPKPVEAPKKKDN